MHASQLRQSPIDLSIKYFMPNTDPVPQAGIEPTRLLRAQDFKSCVYTSFTTAAQVKRADIIQVFYKNPNDIICNLCYLNLHLFQSVLKPPSNH